MYENVFELNFRACMRVVLNAFSGTQVPRGGTVLAAQLKKACLEAPGARKTAICPFTLSILLAGALAATSPTLRC